jgi:hypothetical protein
MLCALREAALQNGRFVMFCHRSGCVEIESDVVAHTARMAWLLP